MALLQWKKKRKKTHTMEERDSHLNLCLYDKLPRTVLSKKKKGGKNYLRNPNNVLHLTENAKYFFLPRFLTILAISS